MSLRSLTVARGFHPIEGRHLFAVQADLPVIDALEQASCLMDCISKLTLGVATETDDTGGNAFAAHYLAEMVKALIDASADGIFHTGGDQ
ncbi:DUF3077 domain-containing protein [Pseudomonas paraeruginosa]|uniref:DUF3077 domain-containing protein n=1 Tax=Pseudomonas paraeruginosa TaxID=2994495 RepID=UPI00068CF7DA|nr:DUF3077 domain-containing protein [Pseudomonas paraeruginosa]